MTPDDILAELDALVSLVRTDPERVLQTVSAVDEDTRGTWLLLAITRLARAQHEQR